MLSRVRFSALLLAAASVLLITLVVFGGLHPRAILFGLLAGFVGSLLAALTQKSESAVIRTMSLFPGIAIISAGIPKAESGAPLFFASAQLLVCIVFAVALSVVLSAKLRKKPPSSDA
jgi:hypothetical protein